MLREYDFSDFFTQLHGYPPFAWQKRLAEQVIESGSWPSAINIPTGYGKTAAIEIAVYALAVNATHPRRTVLVVDRRIVVDHAYATAQNLSDALLNPENYGPALRWVAAKLLQYGGESPLSTAILRGGMYREPSWIRNPAQPMVICSTVDQIGSRLLHRGYGVSDRMLSVHAGFLAHDTLCILDEAHISEPFRQTITAVNTFQSVAHTPLARPIVPVVMSATLGPQFHKEQFTITAEDMKDPRLQKRRCARKLLKLEKASESNMAGKIALEAFRLSEPGSTILIVVNRVHRTRQIAQLIHSRDPDAHRIVITGRSRPVERDRLIEAYRHRLFSGRNREAVASEPPLYVIATQAIEVGADIDADCLVTEACPLPSLLQRAARIDRLGERGESTVVVVGDTALNKAAAKPHRDPIYGLSLLHTWNFLKERVQSGPVDLGNAGWQQIESATDTAILDTLRHSQPDAPVMMPIHCDLWVQTSPLPSASPDPALFLRGMDATDTDVQIVWRADLAADRPRTWIATIEQFPPVPGEALSVPISSVRQWLSRSVDSSLSDMEGVAVTPTPIDEGGAEDGRLRCRSFLIWRGPADSIIATRANELKPADTIVVPVTAGGCDAWGWAPEAADEDESEATQDIADIALARCGAPVIARVHPALPAFWNALQDLHVSHSEHVMSTIETLARRALARAHSQDPVIVQMLSCLADDPRITVHPHPAGEGWIITGGRPRTTAGSLAVDAENGQPTVLKPVTLDAHLDHVGRVARRFADSLELPEHLRQDLVTAAHLHDIGKADGREQTVLYGGNRVLAARGPLLAKSLRPPSSLSALRSMRRQEGMAVGFRHEFLSAHLVEQRGNGNAIYHDEDLVLHLIATHHGLCRPLPPAVSDPQPIAVSLTRGSTVFTASSDLMQDGRPFHHLRRNHDQRFWRLVRRYGWWGLSYLEAILRLADHRASESEKEGVVP